MITFEQDTKQTRINDLNQMRKFKLISLALYRKAMYAINQDNTVVYSINYSTGVVSSIKITAK